MEKEKTITEQILEAIKEFEIPKKDGDFWENKK